MYTVPDLKSAPTKFHHPSIKYPTKSAKGLHTREAKQGLWIHRNHEKAPNSSVRSLKKLKPKLEPLFHHEFSAETGSRVKRTQHLNHRSAKR